jgi:aspartate/methionine/tyrosine aminotransferase
MPYLAPHLDAVPGSGIRRIFEVAVRLDDVIMLAIGEPDRDVAPHIAEAAKRSWDEGETHYGPNAGIADLRAAITAKLSRDNDLRVDVERVWVTVGATQALHQAMALTLGAGDEVLVPDPGYTTFTMNARMLDAVPVPYSLLPQHGFLPDLGQLEALVTQRTRVLVVNSPSNPLGVVFGRQTLQQLLDFAERHDLWVISDEVYEAFTFGAPHVSMASLPGGERVWSAFSLSKTYAMTGVRVGYLVSPPGYADILRTVQEASISCVANPDQRAAVAAIEGDQQNVADAARHYRENYETAAALLAERGIRYHASEGGFYLWIDLGHATEGDVAAWAMDFLLAERVAVAPGSAFGRSGEGWIRICLAATRDDLVTGLGRLPAP